MNQIESPREETPKKEDTTQQRPKQVAHDETPALVTGHKFAPTGAWYTLCTHCRLGEAAHAESELRYVGDDAQDDS